MGIYILFLFCIYSCILRHNRSEDKTVFARRNGFVSCLREDNTVNPVAILLHASFCFRQTPCTLYGSSRNIGCNEPFSRLSKSSRHILTDYAFTSPQYLPGSRDARPEVVVPAGAISLLGPHAHLSTEHEMLPMSWCIRQRIVCIDLAPILQRTAIIGRGLWTG